MRHKPKKDPGALPGPLGITSHMFIICLSTVT